MKVKVVTHYAEDDTDFGGDYYSVDILDAGGNVIARFGDYYHDKGDEKVEGFIQGVNWILGMTGKELEVERENIADGEY